MNIKTPVCKHGRPMLPVTLSVLVSCLLLISVTVEADKTEISDRQELAGGQIPKPARIWVYDFAATASDVPPESALAGETVDPPVPQTDEQIATGKKLGAEMAQELAALITDMGIPAVEATAGSKPAINDLVIQGYFITIDEGSEKKRVGIGFGSGGSELKTAVEGFEVTANGLRKLGGGNLDAKGSKSPGAALGAVGLIATHNPVGLIVGTGVKEHGEKSGSAKIGGRVKQTAKEIADQLKPRFQQQGWIN